MKLEDKRGTDSMRSLAPKLYADLPLREGPAGYICVLRDIDTNRYRIDSAEDLRAFVAAALAETKRAYGIELIALLETEDIAAAAAILYEQHHATLSGDWLHLDKYQLEELRGSILQINAQPSCYISGRRAEKAAPVPSQPARPASPRRYHKRASVPVSQRLARGSSLAEERYGTSSLRRYQAAAASEASPPEPASLRGALGNRASEIWLEYPGYCLALIVLIGLFCVFAIKDESYGSMYASSSSSSRSAATRAVQARDSGAPTPKMYIFASKSPVRYCPRTSCGEIGNLVPGARKTPIEEVVGEEVDGSDLWLKISFRGNIGYVHSSSSTSR